MVRLLGRSRTYSVQGALRRLQLFFESVHSVSVYRHRRRMSHPRSEPQIFDALDTICSTVPVGGLQQGCIKYVPLCSSTYCTVVWSQALH